MSELYPFILNNDSKEEKILPLFKEIAWDYIKDKPVINKETNDFKTVEGDEALKAWIYKAVKIARYRYSIYTSDYGCEIEELVGNKYTRGYTESEAVRYIKEALSINNYIKNINLVEASFEDDLLTVKINIDTVYNEGVELVV